jgi:hypothetical protein
VVVCGPKHGEYGVCGSQVGSVVSGRKQRWLLGGRLLKRHGARAAASLTGLSKTGGDTPSGGGSGLVGKEGGHARFSQLGQFGEEMNFEWFLNCFKSLEFDLRRI